MSRVARVSGAIVIGVAVAGLHLSLALWDAMTDARLPAYQSGLDVTGDQQACYDSSLGVTWIASSTPYKREVALATQSSFQFRVNSPETQYVEVAPSQVGQLPWFVRRSEVRKTLERRPQPVLFGEIAYGYRLPVVRVPWVLSRTGGTPEWALGSGNSQTPTPSELVTRVEWMVCICIACVVVILILGSWELGLFSRSMIRQRSRQCVRCAYPMQGLNTSRCPECGHVVSGAEAAV